MSTKSTLRERFGLREPIPTVDPTLWFSEERVPHQFVLTGEFVRPIDVARRLREAGLTLRAAYAAINELAASLATTCDIPVNVDLDNLARDLTAMNVKLRRRVVVQEPGPFLTEVRARHNLSQRQFADRLGFDVRTLQNWEQGRNRPDPAILNLVRVFDRNPRLVEDAIFEPL